jgi:hypothetical protein
MSTIEALASSKKEKRFFNGRRSSVPVLRWREISGVCGGDGIRFDQEANECLWLYDETCTYCSYTLRMLPTPEASRQAELQGRSAVATIHARSVRVYASI